ncbi:alpha/beta hydrolase [Rhodococcus sp. AG1013]|uniref:alpha/beta hydrolase n=1 Tax=unclassified Rhodococcus (in: high G+C Gram-positive bacteria) TaxID=192944 RepID=UPI000E2C3C82|nr:S-formylglutathione hydrolase FrmB [Rhodococcus sp. AG1013]
MVSPLLAAAPAAGVAAQGGYRSGVSLLGGWLPLTVEIVSVVVLIAVLVRRSRRWWLLWVPVAAALGVAAAATAHWFVGQQGLASDPAPIQLWAWSAVFVAAIAIAVLGWRGTRWWRRGLSIVLIPSTFACVALTLNQWVGYYPTVQTAWGAATAGPVPDQVDAADLPVLRNTTMSTGKVVPVDVPDAASGFKHRTEYVYLPPAWFAGDTPPALPVIMMVGGEFNTAADWLRTGGAVDTVDAYAQAHGGQAPILVFVDAGGSFNNDTECVDGPRGNSASHLVDDVRPYVVSTFGASANPENWGVVGWSMGGTCAVDLIVMHPDLFSTFEDIAGDVAPTAGTDEQTLDRLYGGDTALRDRFDPTKAMTEHRLYQGISGWFQDSDVPPRQGANLSGPAPAPSPGMDGTGGHDDTHDAGETGAAEQLCATASSVGISCEVHTSNGRHTWQFAAQGFADALPWLAVQIQTPGSATP